MGTCQNWDSTLALTVDDGILERLCSLRPAILDISANNLIIQVVDSPYNLLIRVYKKYFHPTLPSLPLDGCARQDQDSI